MTKRDSLDLSQPWAVWILIAVVSIGIRILLAIYQLAYVTWYIAAFLAMITAVCWMGLSLIEKHEKLEISDHGISAKRADVLMLLFAIICFGVGFMKLENNGLWSTGLLIIFTIIECFMIFSTIFTTIGSIRSFAIKYISAKRSKQK